MLIWKGNPSWWEATVKQLATKLSSLRYMLPFLLPFQRLMAVLTGHMKVLTKNCRSMKSLKCAILEMHGFHSLQCKVATVSKQVKLHIGWPTFYSHYLHQLLKARAPFRGKQAGMEVTAIPIFIWIIRVGFYSKKAKKAKTVMNICMNKCLTLINAEY